jgi:hypothetical protein
MKLFELTEEIRQIEGMLEDDSVDEESFSAALGAVEGERDSKIANIGFLVKNLSADLDARKTVIASMQKQNRSTENHIRWLKDYALAHIDKTVKTPLISVRKQQGQERAVVGDEAQLPDEYYQPPAERSLKLRELTAALQAGEEFHDVGLERGADFLVVR